MKVREATAHDIERMVTMGRRFLHSTRYSDVITENPEQMRITLQWLIETDDHAIFVAERDDRVLVGMIAVLFLPQHPISGDPIASELFWWMEPEQRGGGMRLFYTAERWATEKGAKTLQMIAPSDDVAALYLRLGFTRVEVLFQKSLVKAASRGRVA